MAKKMTKKRNSARLRKQMKKRQERLVTMGVYAFLVLCVGAFVSIGLMNSRATDRAETEWYVRGEQIEILAPPMGSTMDRGSTDSAASGLPFLQPTATSEPAHLIMPTPVPQPTENPMEVLEPEATLEAVSVPITITAVGDCTLGGDIPSGAYRSFESYVTRCGYDYFFENVRDLFESDDLTIVNLEGPLTTSNDLREGRAFNFRGDPSYVNILSGSSVEIANVANNHAMDFGESGLSETASVLEAAGIGVSGFSRVYLTEIQGVKVCSIGFTEWAYSEAQIEKMVGIARSQCDLLIVSMHWGEEGSHETTSTQRSLGHAIIDAGADVVLGTHPHVYGGFELYNGKYIVYSLGNFCFGGNRNPNDKNCIIFQQTFNVGPDGTVSDGGISIIPARVSSSDDTNDFKPMILTDHRAQKIFSGIAKVSRVETADVKWMNDSYQVSSGMVSLENSL